MWRFCSIGRKEGWKCGPPFFFFCAQYVGHTPTVRSMYCVAEGRSVWTSFLDYRELYICTEYVLGFSALTYMYAVCSRYTGRVGTTLLYVRRYVRSMYDGGRLESARFL